MTDPPRIAPVSMTDVEVAANRSCADVGRDFIEAPRVAASQKSAAQAVPRLALSAEEVAELLGIGRSHLYQLKSSGRLPRPIRLGRSVRWDLVTLQAWLAAGAPPRDRWEEMQRVPTNARGGRR